MNKNFLKLFTLSTLFFGLGFSQVFQSCNSGIGFYDEVQKSFVPCQAQEQGCCVLCQLIFNCRGLGSEFLFNDTSCKLVGSTPPYKLEPSSWMKCVDLTFQCFLLKNNNGNNKPWIVYVQVPCSVNSD